MFDTIKMYLMGFLLTVALITGGLYLSTRSSLKSLESKHTQLKQDYTELSGSKDKVVEGNKQDDSLSTAQILRIQELEKDKQSLLDKLNNIPKDTSPKPSPCKTVVVKGEIVNEINIDAELPADINSLLNNAYKNKRSTSSASR